MDSNTIQENIRFFRFLYTNRAISFSTTPLLLLAVTTWLCPFISSTEALVAALMSIPFLIWFGFTQDCKAFVALVTLMECCPSDGEKEVVKDVATFLETDALNVSVETIPDPQTGDNESSDNGST